MGHPLHSPNVNNAKSPLTNFPAASYENPVAAGDASPADPTGTASPTCKRTASSPDPAAPPSVTCKKNGKTASDALDSAHQSHRAHSF